LSRVDAELGPRDNSRLRALRNRRAAIRRLVAPDVRSNRWLKLSSSLALRTWQVSRRYVVNASLALCMNPFLHSASFRGKTHCCDARETFAVRLFSLTGKQKEQRSGVGSQGVPSSSPSRDTRETADPRLSASYVPSPRHRCRKTRPNGRVEEEIRASVAVRRARSALSEQRELLPACIAARLYDHVVDTTGDRSAPIV